MNHRLSNLSAGPLLVAVSVVALLSLTTCASAQYQNTGTTSQRLIQDAVGYGHTAASLSQSTLSQGGFGARGNSISSSGPATFGNSRPASKPFTGSTSRPTVSPYLGLFNNGLLGDEISNYNTIVRPQLRQQQINQQFQRQAQALNRQFQQAVARPSYNPQGSERMMATGHRTLFNYTSHFYPSRSQR